MKKELLNELVDETVEQVEPGDLIYLKRAVKYVTDRMELSVKICKELFGDEASVNDVYTMFNYLSKETNMQYAAATLQKTASKMGGLSPLPPLTDDEIN